MIRVNSLPLGDVIVTSPFGQRDLIVNGVHYWRHNGADFKAFIGTPIYAVANGTIRVAKNNPGGYGNYIVLDCGEFGALYAHLSKFNCTVGQEVEAGTLIGFTGNTGASIGPHLHFEIRECKYKDFWERCKTDRNVFMRCVDPMPYILRFLENKNITKEKAIGIIKDKVGLQDKTIQFLNFYKYGDDLIKKIAKAIN